MEADDQVIRQAYLQAIKESPPDTDPKRFQAASQAYQKIKDQASRHRHFLFNQDCPGDSPLDVLARFGKAFNDARYVSLIWLVVPVIGLLERAGLQARASALVARVRVL